MSDKILLERNGDIVTITLNRPHVGNLMTNEMGAMLASMLDSASEPKLVVLRGAGKDFCLGRDLAPPDPRYAPTALGVRKGNTAPALARSALVDRVPRKAIMDMVYSTDEFDARRALAIGLISRVVAAKDLQR